jgi:penicillin G amidase
MRNNDTSLFGGSSWDELLKQALIQASDVPLEPWGKRHLPKLSHLLAPVFREQSSLLNRVSTPVASDNDTVFATGYASSVGARTIYASLARYVFDVGTWENCQWIVFHGVSGDPTHPWDMNQNPIWAKGEMIPMLYDWSGIRARAISRESLIFNP